MEFLVKTEEIGGEELRLARELPRPWLDEILGGEEPTGFTAAGPGQVEVRLMPLAEGFLLRGRAKVSVSSPCRRCLADVKLDLPVEFTLNLVEASRAGHEPEEKERGRDRDDEQAAGTFDAELADEEVFHNKVIDLGGILREQILLALPMHALCREDCKGLCPVCGQDLNEKECGHDGKVPDPRWAGLSNIKPTRH